MNADEMSNMMADAIIEAVSIIVARATYTIIDRGKIITVNSPTSYIVQVNGDNYNISSLGLKTYAVGEIVRVFNPKNNFSDIFLP